MGDQTALKSIMGLKFYKKQKDWKFTRENPTFDFDRHPEQALRRYQSREKHSSFNGDKIPNKRSFDSTVNFSIFNRSNSNRDEIKNNSEYCPNISYNNHSKNISGTIKSDLNETYDIKKYDLDFDIFNDDAMICDDIDGRNVTKHDTSASRTELDGMPELVSEEDFLKGTKKIFHSSAKDISTFNGLSICNALTPFTPPVYEAPDEEELERMRKMSYKEIMSEIVLEHMQMQQHFERKNALMVAMVDKIELDCNENININQDFNYVNFQSNKMLTHSNHSVRFVSGPRPRFPSCTTSPRFWNM